MRVFDMLRGSSFLAMTLLVLSMLVGSNAVAQTPPPATPPVAAPFQCAFDEYPSTDNGVTTCKKVPTCKKDEVNSYDTATQKFVCKKLVICDPKRQQAAYINGKNVCIDIPDCEGKGQHYAFDGTKMICK